MTDQPVSAEARKIAAAWVLAVDAVTAEVGAALEAGDVPFVIVKGPATARLLYDNPAERVYGDSDVLVHPNSLDLAERVLRRLGFERAFGAVDHAEMGAPPAAPWLRDGHGVDLHVRIPGVGASPEAAFEVIRAGAEQVEVGGRPVPLAASPLTLLHVVLHAWHHGPALASPLEDLSGATGRCGAEEWAAAAAAARSLGCLDEFSTALVLVAGGRSVLDRLGLVATPTRAWLLRADGTPLAEGLDRLIATPGLGPRLSVLRDEVAPTADFMRWSSALARRSRRGLAAAYAVRLARLALGLGPALRVWLRVRAQARRNAAGVAGQGLPR